jgi:hypothetical protein
MYGVINGSSWCASVLNHWTKWSIIFITANIAVLTGEVVMKLSSMLAAKLSALAGVLIFSVAGAGIVHAAEYDMPAEIAPGDSSAVRDTTIYDGKQNGAEKKKMQKEDQPSSSKKRDNSRYSTDGVERYEEDKEYSGTGPKREGRY